MENKTPKWAIVVVLLMVAGSVALVVQSTLNKRVQKEDPEQRRQEILAAFQNPPPDGDDPKQFLAFFDAFGKELSTGNVPAIQLRFNFSRMYDEVNHAGVLRQHDVPRDMFVRGLDNAISRNLGNTELNPLQWSRTQIRLVKWLEPGREAMVITRHFEQDAPDSMRMRWWLVWDGTRWRIYDYEELESGLRATVLIGTVVSEMFAQHPDIAQIEAMTDGIQSLKEGRAALLRGELDEGERLLKRVSLTRMPSAVKAMYYMWSGVLHNRRARPLEALAEFDKAEQIYAEMPVLHMVRAQAYFALAQHQKTLEYAARYIDVLGPDVVVYHLMGTACEALHRPDEAADYFRKALDDTPEDQESWQGLSRTAPDKARADLARFLPRLKANSWQFNSVYYKALQAKDFNDCRSLIALLRDSHPESVEVRVAEIGLHAKQGKFDEASTIMKDSLRKFAKSAEHARILNAYLFDMADAGKMIEAYQAVPDQDATAAFKTLADSALDLDDEDPKAVKPADRLRQLVDAHRKRQPDDIWLHFYAGQMHQLNKEFDAAEKDYAAGMAQQSDEQTRATFRSTRVYARFEAGRGLSAYADIGPSEETFGQLAALFNNLEHVADLEKLIDMHRTAAPREPSLALWQAEILWLRQQYPKAIVQYRTYRPAKENANQYEFTPGFPYLWEEHLVRSLLRTGQFAEASRELNRPRLKYYAVLRAAVAAGSGDVAATEKELAEMVQKNIPLASFYRDPDLGPLLRGDKFRKLREKYPEPKPEKPPISF